jgi:hypothetical protein
LREHLAWLLAGDLGRDKLALLVLCMLSMSVLAAHLYWRMCGPVGQRQGILRRTWVGRWLVECLRLFFCVGIPLAVLGRGALVREMGLPVTLVGPASLPPEDGTPAWSGITRGLAWIGLSDARALVQLGAGLAVGAGALAVLVAVWVWYARVVLARADLRFETPPRVPWWDALRQALLAQFLWAFYRGFALLLVPDRVQAGLLALALISIPWALNPRHWHDLLSTRGYLVVQEWLLALFTVLVSFATNLLWILIPMHMVWVWVSGRLLAHLSARSAQEARTGSTS